MRIAVRKQMHLPDTLFKDSEWMQGGTDANPLFSAALPNRFVAVVPASQARAIAEQVTQAVRGWLQRLGEDVVMRLLDVAGFDKEATRTPYDQMKAQLDGFPEVHWASVPFSLICPRNPERQTDLDTSVLSEAMAPFFHPSPSGESEARGAKPAGGEGNAATAHGFLATPAWQALRKEIDWGDGTTFFAPNPGILYPAVYDLAERVMAAAKAARTFAAGEEGGWRCSLTGETEWLTTDRAQLATPPGQRTDTLWTRVAGRKPAWAKKGEHLGALPAIKRLWPTLFAEEVGKALAAGERGEKKDIGRFVVSTHTMALAHQLDRWLEGGGHTAEGFTAELQTQEAEPVALPRRLMIRHARNPALADAKRLPGLLEAAREADDDEAYERALRLVRKTLAHTAGFDSAQPAARGEREPEDGGRLETYYALIMLDGDRMGAILSGVGADDDPSAIPYRDSFHPQVRAGFDQQAAGQPLIQAYGEQKRPISPNRHLAISGALNDFSQTVVRHIVEDEYLGRVIYAGGDDVLAMLPVADLLPVMQRLRQAYAGQDPEHEGGTHQGLTLRNGFAALKVRRGGKERLKLMRMMGRNATASCGAVVAHHQAPLGAVLRELRAAEQRAKHEGGRDAFSMVVIKRSGGALRLTEKWGEPVRLLSDLIAFLRAEGVSRRAVYHTLEWLHDLPDPGDDAGMLESLLGYQLARQADDKSLKAQAPGLARRLAALTAAQSRGRLKWLENFLTVGEFLARETRAGGDA